MATNKLGLPTITSNMSANVPRDMNALADAIDSKVPSNEEFTNHTTDSTIHLKSSDVRKHIEETSFKTIKSGKDSEGVFTTLEYRRKSDNTLAAKSVLSGGTAPKYTTRTITYYAPDGVTVTKVDKFTLTYDANDDELISEV